MELSGRLCAMAIGAVRSGLVGAAALTGFGLANAEAAEWTGYKIVQGFSMAMSFGTGVGQYYFWNGTGWGASGCPNATWAYVNTDRVGAKELLSVVMQARQMGKSMTFWGNCNGAAYFIVDQVSTYD